MRQAFSKSMFDSNELYVYIYIIFNIEKEKK